MEKPLSVKREDFITALVELINASALPSCVALEVMEKITADVANAARQQYELDRTTWEESQKEAEDGQDHAG